MSDATLTSQIRRRIRRAGRGNVFTPKDFRSVASRAVVDQSLSRLVKSGDIQRVARGIYSYPRINRRLGIAVPPEINDVADALARQTGSRIVPSGAAAVNQLGLSTQVPAKPIYLTDGRSRTVRVGRFYVVMKHVPPKEFPPGSRTSATVIQALRYLGKDSVNHAVINQLRKQLSPDSRRRLLQDAQYTTDWISDAAREIADDEKQQEKGTLNGRRRASTAD